MNEQVTQSIDFFILNSHPCARLLVSEFPVIVHLRLLSANNRVALFALACFTAPIHQNLISLQAHKDLGNQF